MEETSDEVGLVVEEDSPSSVAPLRVSGGGVAVAVAAPQQVKFVQLKFKPIREITEINQSKIMHLQLSQPFRTPLRIFSPAYAWRLWS